MLQINKDQLKQFYKKCQKDKLIGIDTEFYRVDTYYPKLCLIQLANKNESIFRFDEKFGEVVPRRLLPGEFRGDARGDC